LQAVVGLGDPPKQIILRAELPPFSPLLCGTHQNQLLKKEERKRRRKFPGECSCSWRRRPSQRVQCSAAQSRLLFFLLYLKLDYDFLSEDNDAESGQPRVWITSKQPPVFTERHPSAAAPRKAHCSA